MEATTKRPILLGENYNHLFGVAHGENELIKKSATLDDTLTFIPKVVKDTMYQTRGIAKELEGKTLYDTCRNIWTFVYRHIAYKKDEQGKEQIRSPWRTWQDRQGGVDCDCYSVFISSILSNLNIKHTLRVAKYTAGYFQHIYPIVPTGKDTHYTLDCVVDTFNYEVPFTQKKDIIMQLEFLNGLDVDHLESMDDMEMGFLNILKKKTPTPLPVPTTNTSTSKPKFGERLKTAVQKTVHVVNRINPGAVALRTGVLAAMKLNTFKVAQRLKYAYLTEQQAQQKGIDLAKFRRLVEVRKKLENIFHGAGGKPENLRSAIVTGKGNANRAVAGFDGLGDVLVITITKHTPLRTVLGDELYLSEYVKPEAAMGELGEPITLATVAAAVPAIAAIAGLLKSIGNIFPKKTAESSDFADTAQVDAQAESGQITEATLTPDGNVPSNYHVEQLEPQMMVSPSSTSTTTTTSTSDTSSEKQKNAEDDEKQEGFWDNNKSWLKPTLITVGGVTLLVGGYYMLKPKPQTKPVSGVESTEKKAPEKPKRRKRRKKQGITTVTLKN